AIGYAISLGGSRTVTFDPSVFGTTQQTITLTGGALNITNTGLQLTIQGPGASLLSISGNNTSQVISSNTGSLTLSRLTITEGNAGPGGSGGGLLSFNQTTLTDCVISDRSARDGGGVEIGLGFPLTLPDCPLINNTASNKGGALRSDSATATLTNCAII